VVPVWSKGASAAVLVPIRLVCEGSAFTDLGRAFYSNCKNSISAESRFVGADSVDRRHYGCRIGDAFTRFGSNLGMMPLPGASFVWLLLILTTYCALAQQVKGWLARRYGYYITETIVALTLRNWL
jgi:hypothetical protein